jgi:hypothetical protein
MICGSDGILAKPTNDNGKIANGSEAETVFRGRGCVRALGSGEAETVFRGRGCVRALG